MSADARSSRLFGIAGVVMALCCLAGPAIVAAAAGAAIGNLLGIAAAVLVALAGVLVLRRWRGSDSNGC
jgi:hypothetical protein